ncbi:uncharacterized protein LOC119693991 [Plutella xylostella]|uniref:uncharacterized protein LOC119693991 n=1 Tax=Plutella xylostella TaxID=51655 RepID=UPI002033067B|nr:uncharacterized protein LOC119693991 [Plutella xylostella]
MWALLLLGVCAAAGADCPRHCECKWRSGKESALCARAGLAAVPPRLPPTTQLLDLSENRLGALRDDAFAGAGLLNLQRLYLAACGVRAVRPRALRALVNLVELDLARNRLEAVPSPAFAEIPELRELRLDGNPITKIKDDAFASLTHLVRLSLRSCKIAEIEPRSFIGLEGTLEYLELDKNRLQVLHVGALAPLRALKGLELANNPWDCSCALRPVRDWMLRRNVPATVAPECARPPRLSATAWDRLDLDDFACLPEVSADTKHTIGTESDDVTLVCRVNGVPAPRVRWLRGGRLIANSTSVHNINSGRSFFLRSEGQTSNLTIKSVELQDAGSYVCAAENRAGKAEAALALAVQRRPAAAGGRALLAGVAVSAVVVLSLCLVALCAYETRKKRELDRWNEQIVTTSRRAESYEKIEMSFSKEAEEEARRAGAGGEAGGGGGRKRGEYQDVPSHDSEEEGEGYGARALRARGGARGAGAWPCEPPRDLYSRRQEQDLHIPRLMDYDIRADATPESAPGSASSGGGGGGGGEGAARARDDNALNNNPPRRRDRLDNDLSGSDSEKNYPDLIEMSALGTSYLRNEKKRDPYFYTIPRRKDTDSRSPLLGSRRNSSGGDSFSSFERPYDPRQKPGGRRSNSFLDLATGNSRGRRNPSLPASPARERPPVPSATPLLDLSGLRDYSRHDQPLPDDYDFRASQLEKFLDEYRNLREQLSKMKETRENLQRNRAAEHDELRSILKGRPSVAVTETSSLAALADAASPLSLGAEPRPEWISTLMYRN